MQSDLLKSIATDVYIIKDNEINDNHSRQVNIIFIPGNPGTLEYYIDFLEEFYERCYARKLICCELNLYGIGHLNHHLINEDIYNESYERFDLNDQINHKIEYLTKIIMKSEYKTMEFMFISHSIGSYIVFDILNRDSVIRSHTGEVISLMPFILWKNIPFSHKLKLQTYTNLYTIVHPLIAYLAYTFLHRSNSFKKSFVKYSTGMKDGYLLDITSTKLPSRRLIQNFFSMGRSEIETIAGNDEYSLSTLKKLDIDKMPMCFIYTNDDVWAPESDCQVLMNNLHNNRNHIQFCRDVTHGFTLVEEGSQRVINEIMKYYSNRKRQNDWIYHIS